MTDSATVKEAREAAGLSAREAAELLGVTTLTWQRWEGQSARTTEIPYAHWNLFLLLTGRHPVYTLEKKMLTREQISAINGEAYAKNLDQAVEYAAGLIAKGVGYYSATEQANEEFGVSLPDIQGSIMRTTEVKNDDIEIKADFSQASSQIKYRMIGESEWKGTPFQVADASHIEESALRLVDEWLERQG